MLNNNSKLKVFSGRANIPLGDAIARCLGDGLGKITLDYFPDGENLVRIDEDVRGRDIYIVQPTCPPVNTHLMELLIILDAFKRLQRRPHHGRPALLRLRPAGSQRSGTCADHRQARGRSAQFGRRRSRPRS